MRKRVFPLRKGMATIDYVLVVAVAVPISAWLFYTLVRALKAFYYFSSIALGWLVY